MAILKLYFEPSKGHQPLQMDFERIEYIPEVKEKIK
jgi:hypothetical protein